MMRAALFIDAANVFYSEKTMGWKIDFAKVYEYFNKHFALYNAFYYSAEPQEGEEEKQKEYRDFSLMGYTMRLKQLKEIYDSRGKLALKKANLDIEMVVDMFATQQNYDIAILFTGDSDFTRAVELLRMNGKQIFVLSTKGHSGLELINASDKFMDFQDLRKTFEQKYLKKTPEKKTVQKKKEQQKQEKKSVKKTVKKSVKKQVKQTGKQNNTKKSIPQKTTDEKNIMPSNAVIEKAMKAIEEKNKKIKKGKNTKNMKNTKDMKNEKKVSNVKKISNMKKVSNEKK